MGGIEKSRKRLVTDVISAKKTALIKAKEDKEVCVLGFVVNV